MPKNNSYNLLEYKEKQRISHLGNKNGMFGKHRSEKLLEKIKNCDRNRLMGFRKLFNNLTIDKNRDNKKKNLEKISEKKLNIKIRNSIKFIFKEKKYDILKIKKPGAGLNHPHNIKSRYKISIAHSNRWKDEKFKKRRIYENRHILLPSSFENKIIMLCRKYNLPFEYCGNGAELIEFKNPDFINKNKKIVIEVFYSYYKLMKYHTINNYKRYCKYLYEKNGYRVIFIDEYDITNKNWENICLYKINKYLNTKIF